MKQKREERKGLKYKRCDRRRENQLCGAHSKHIQALLD